MHAVRRAALSMRVGCSLAASMVVAGRWRADCDTRRPLDPESCANPVCADKVKLFDMMKNLGSSGPSSGSKQRAPGAKTTSSHKGEPTSAGSEGKPVDSIAVVSIVKEEDCPLDRSEVGHSTWNFLHSLAANYPDHPSDEQKGHARSLFHAIAILYPCPTCAKDFQENITQSPPR